MKFLCILFCVLTGIAAVRADVKLSLPQDKPDWVFRPGEAIEFTVTGGEAPLQMTLRDFHGVERKADAAVADGKVRLEPLPPGFYTLQVASARQTLAVIPDPPAETAETSNPFGVNFHFTRVPVAEAERELLTARRIGINWGRGILFDWAETEPDFQVSLEKYRELVDMLGRHDMNYLGGIYFMPSWASSAPITPGHTGYVVWSRAMPEKLDQVEQFCRNIAKAAPVVKYWEVGNECDLEGMWKGRYKNFTARNLSAIVADYVDFLKAADKGFKEGNPSAKTLYNGIATLNGGSYPGFFRQTLEMGAAPYFDIMNIHYKVSMAETRELLKRFGKADCPIWVTELGSYAVGTKSTNGDAEQIVQDVEMSVRQLNDGAAHVFKYDLRNDGDSPSDIESNFGLVYRDFSPKPAYVAYATLVRMLTNAAPDRELNVVTQSDRGWLKGFAFRSKRLGKPVNVLWLNAVESAVVTLKTGDAEITRVDSMGGENVLKAVNGTVSFPVDNLPFYLVGNLSDNPGKIVYPQDQMTKSLVYPLNNPGFEKRFTDNRTIPGWEYRLDPEFMTLKDSASPREGGRALRVDLHTARDLFTGIGQWVEITPFEVNLGPDEYLKLKASAWIKRDNLVGRGLSLSISFYDRDDKRLSWQETLYEPGTHDWREDILTVERIPEGTRKIRLEFWTAPLVTGSFELDRVSLEIQTWERPAKRR